MSKVVRIEDGSSIDGQAISGPTLNSGGGSGTFDGMLERIVRLEAGAASLQRDVTDLRGDMKDARDRLSRLEVKVDHLPSKGFIVTATVLSLTVATGLILFGERIISLLVP